MGCRPFNARDTRPRARRLGKKLDLAFEEYFQSPIPENLNEAHQLVIAASEFDASSRRIVEYLAEEHDISINTAFFNTFEHNGKVLLATDWQLDQEKVKERAERKAKAPWSGLWYVNVDDGESRAWEDMRKYGFLSAGGGRVYSDALRRLALGSKVLAYQKKRGYVGFGATTAPPVPVSEFTVGGKPILEQQLQQPRLGHDEDNLDQCEYLVGVKWYETLPIDQAKTFNGAFANQNIVCKLRQAATIEFLTSEFHINSHLQTLTVSGTPVPLSPEFIKAVGPGISGAVSQGASIPLKKDG